MLKPVAAIPLLPSTCLALEMVVTITSDPTFFSALAGKVKRGGGRVVVIVARPPEARTSTVQELAKYGLHYDDVIFLPAAKDAIEACPYREELGRSDSYLWHKVHIADLAGVTHYVGHESVVKDLFKRFLPMVTVIYPRELYPRRRPSPDNINGSWLFHPPSDEEYVELTTTPWEPVRMYFVSFCGNMEALYRAVTKLNGALYKDGMVVMPSGVTLSDINGALKTDESGTVIKSWSETWAGPPGQ